MWQQITYAGWCALGGLAGPLGRQGRLMSRPVHLGRHYLHTTYWMRSC